MSLDYSTYAKTRRRSVRSVRTAAKAVLARYPGRALQPVEDERDDDELRIEGLGGPIHVTTWGFGIELSINSTDGGRENFAALGELADEICAELGTRLDADEARALIAAETEDEAPAAAKPGGLHVNRVHIVLRGHDGEELVRASVSCNQFFAQRGHRGELLPELRVEGAPAILGEEGRLAYRGKTLDCLVHDESGRPATRWVYELDGYGRIKGFTQQAP